MSEAMMHPQLKEQLNALGLDQTRPPDAELWSEFLGRLSRAYAEEEAQRAGDDLYRQIVSLISHHIYVTEITAEGHQINHYLSPQVEPLTGYPLKNFIEDWSFWPTTVIHPDDREAAARQAARLARGQASEMEYRLVKADGTVSWVRDSGRVEKDEARQSLFVYGVVSDVTERKQAEEALANSLAESEVQARRLVQLNEMSAQFNLVRNEEEVFDIAARRTAKIIQAGRVSISLFSPQGDTFDVLTLHGDAGTAPAGSQVPVKGTAIAKAVEENRAIVTPDTAVSDFYGHRAFAGRGLRSIMNVPLVTGGQALGTLNVADKNPNAYTPNDVNIMRQIASLLASSLENRRLFEQIQQRAVELEETTTFLNSILDNLPVAVFIKEAEDLRFSVLNKAYEKMLGVDRKEALGKNDYDYFSQEEADFFTASDRETLKGGKLIDISEEPIHTGHQGLRWLQTKKVPVFGPDGQAKYLLGISEDITERRQAEQEIAKQATELATVAQVSTAVSTILEADRLLQEVVNLTKESFNLHYVHIFLLDDTRDVLVLAAGAGEVGAQIVAEGERIPVAQAQSLVARAARTRQGIIVNDIREDPYFLPHPLLPDTRSEMVVPMIVGERVLGVLDAQAPEVGRFDEEDVRIQTTLAAQVAIALDKARLLDRMEASLSQVQRLATIVENQTDFMGVSDLEGNALYINPGGLAMMGLPPDYDISAMTVIDFFPAEDAEVLIKEGVPTAQESGAWSRESHLLMVDGTVIPVDKSITINYDAAGEMYSFNMIMRDISERKAAEAERERLLAEVEATVRQYVAKEWDQFLGQYQQKSWQIEHKQPGMTIEEDDEALNSLQEEVRHQGRTKVISGTQNNGHHHNAAIVAPIPLRSQTIGTFSLEDINPNRQWTEEEVALVEAVSEQLALTVENLRLFDDTQKRAGREQITREITDKMRASPDIDTIIQVGVQELAKVLGGSHTVVELHLGNEEN